MPSMTACWMASSCGGVGRAWFGRPQSAGSTTTAVDAASASGRNGSGRARTSLRNAALTSGVAADDGPATRNRARASAAVRPLRSVRAPPMSCQPPLRPGFEYTGTPAMPRASRSLRGGPLRDLELGRDLGRGDLPARLQVHEDGHEPVGAHVRILARNPDSL